MKSYKTLTLGAVISSVLLAASFQANAATWTGGNASLITDTSGVTSTDFVNTNGASWVSESMGFQGWTHFSKWGFVKLTKGKSVTITADATAVAGYHPGITVWQRKTTLTSLPIAVPAKPTSSSSVDQQLFYMNEHSYPQASSISVLNASDEDANFKVGNIIMNYVASGYDTDGLGDKFAVDAGGMLRPAVKYVAGTSANCKTAAGVAVTTATDEATCTATAGNIWTAAVAATGDASYLGPYLPLGYNTSGLANSQKVSDSTAGKVAITFTAPATGIYQFVVGGLKPDLGSAAAVNAGKMMGNAHTVKVTVKQQ